MKSQNKTKYAINYLELVKLIVKSVNYVKKRSINDQNSRSKQLNVIMHGVNCVKLVKFAIKVLNHIQNGL